MSLRRALNVVWHFLTKDGDRKGIDALKLNLVRPLPGMSEEVSDDVVSAELDLFRKSLTAMGKG